MSIPYQIAKRRIEEIIENNELLKKGTKADDAFRGNISKTDQFSIEGLEQRRKILQQDIGFSGHRIKEAVHAAELPHLKGNIENFIGFAKIPIGIAGPLLVSGTAASGHSYFPLATTEGALVASYNRGCKIASQAGGIRSICLTQGVQRSPVFKFRDLIETGKFIAWLVEQWPVLEEITAKSSRYAKLKEFKTNVEGNNCNIILEFSTGDAAGQNMVTFCTQAICQYLIDKSPVKPHCWYIESNLSGDKKANFQSFQHVRGKKVVAEVLLPKKLVERQLHVSPEKIEDYWKTSTLSQVQAGSIGAQGHIANGLTALFIACGQDVACISEASVGISRFECDENGDLYACLSLPNLIVGTVGGGTALPTQKECLEMIDCYGEGKAVKFAEICTALALAGEISIAAAIAAGHFAKAHQKYGR